MCYASPGPRCSSHAFEAMERARTAYEKADTLSKGSALKEYRESQRAYFATPAGLKHLSHEAEKAEKKGQKSRAAKFKSAHHKYADKRRAQILEMKLAGFEFKEDPNENNVERCDQCGQFANKNHTCPGREVSPDVTSLQLDKRVDIHAPAATEFDPQKYNSVSVLDLKDPTMHEAIKKLEDEGYVLGNGSRSQCGHCGTRIRYAALLKRTDVKEYIFVGEQCLDNRFKTNLTAQEFQRLRKEAALNRERVARVKRIDKLVDDHPHLAWLTYPEETKEWASGFTNSVGYQLRKNGRLTEAQINASKEALSRDVKRYEERIAAEKAKEEEKAKAAPAPNQKNYTFQAQVLSTRMTPGYAYNSPDVKKMRVKHPDGWEAWMTVPAAISEVKVGDNIYLTADVTPSDKDPKFAFAKRPRKAIIIDEDDL